MSDARQRRLARAGWRTGTVQDFLGLTDAEAAWIETSVTLAAALRAARRRKRMRLDVAARAAGMSRSAFAKLERGNPSATMDELLHALLALGVSPRELGQTLLNGARAVLKSSRDAARASRNQREPRRVPTHPGRVLREELLSPMGLSLAELSQHLRVPAANAFQVLAMRLVVEILHRVRAEQRKLVRLPELVP